MKRGINTIDDLRERSIVDAVSRCWHFQGATIKGRPRIWTADLDVMDKRVLSGPRAVWYIAHGTRLGSLCAYMGCWTADCVCPVHVRRGTRLEVNQLSGLAGLRNGHHQVRAVSAAKARTAAGHHDTPDETVRAVRLAAGSATGAELARRFGIAKTVASRILRGATYKHLEPA